MRGKRAVSIYPGRCVRAACPSGNNRQDPHQQGKLARKQVLTCEYDELSENNLLNQILKTTVMLLIRHAKVDAEYKSDLKKEMLFFSAVDTIEPASIKWSSIRFQRSNQSYRMLISLCQFVLEGMLLTRL